MADVFKVLMLMCFMKITFTTATDKTYYMDSTVCHPTMVTTLFQYDKGIIIGKNKAPGQYNLYQCMLTVKPDKFTARSIMKLKVTVNEFYVGPSECDVTLKLRDGIDTRGTLKESYNCNSTNVNGTEIHVDNLMVHYERSELYSEHYNWKITVVPYVYGIAGSVCYNGNIVLMMVMMLFSVVLRYQLQ